MATRIDFIEIDSPRPDIVACRKVAELYGDGERVCVLAPGRAEAEVFDQLLWTFDDQTFIPHSFSAGENDDPVAISVEPSNPNGAGTLLVLGNVGRDLLLEAAGRFDTVVDFAPKAPRESTELARERYRALSGAGYAVSFKPIDR